MKADTHEQAAASAARARDMKLGVERGKAGKAVDPQLDTFAANARRAKDESWSKTPGPREPE